MGADGVRYGTGGVVGSVAMALLAGGEGVGGGAAKRGPPTPLLGRLLVLAAHQGLRVEVEGLM